MNPPPYCLQILNRYIIQTGVGDALEESTYGFGPLEKYAWSSLASIHIIVKGGHVTLEGVVDNQSDKDAAYLRANSVANVFSVTNNLKVVK